MEDREVQHLRDTMDDIQARITRQIERQERERAEAARSLAHSMEKLEKYVETLHQDHQGQLDRRIATSHRELADARAHLEALIATGDSALRQHVVDQVGQIRQAIEGTEKLACARVGDVKADLEAWKAMATAEHDAIRREHDIVRAAADRAIEKSEASVRERLYESNRFREQILQERGQYALREAVNEQIQAAVKQQNALASRVDRLEGERRGVAGSVNMAVALITVIVIVVNVALALL